MTLDNRTRWLALIVLCLGDLMIVLDTTIVNVALPSIRDGSRLLADLARLGRERLPAHVRRLPAARRPARRPLRPAAAVPDRDRALHAAPRSPAAWRTRRACSSAARAVQGVGGAVVSAVALSLIMTLFTEPGERAKAMGVFGFVTAGGGSIGVLLGGVLTDSLDWHWIFLVNLPIGVRRLPALAARCCPPSRVEAGGRASRRRRRRHGDGSPDARRLRDRERQPERAGRRPRRSACSAPPWRCSRSSSRSSRGSTRRSCRSGSSGCATWRPRTSSACCGPQRCSRGSSSRRSTCSSCSATARSRSVSRSCRRT